MSPLRVYHSAPRRCREGIEQRGLLCGLPNLGQIFGVFTFVSQDEHTHVTQQRRWQSGSFNRPRANRIYWAHDGRNGNDLWEVSYIGPLTTDDRIDNALVLLECAEMVSLVSHLS